MGFVGIETPVPEPSIVPAGAGWTHNPEIAEGQALPVKAETITGTSDLEGGLSTDTGYIIRISASAERGAELSPVQ